MIKLKGVTDDKCWPFNLPQFTASSIFIPDYWGLKCCINGRGAVQHYESTGQYIQVFILPPSPREVILMWMCLYSVLSCLNRGIWKTLCLRQHVLPGLHQAFSHHCLIVSLRCPRRRHYCGTNLTRSAAILKNECLSCCRGVCALQWGCRQM